MQPIKRASGLGLANVLISSEHLDTRPSLDRLAMLARPGTERRERDENARGLASIGRNLVYALRR